MNNIAIIIVNYNAGYLVSRNIEKIINSTGCDINIHLYIVDNQSTDDSFNILFKKIQEISIRDKVTLIKSDKNGGFAYGNNVGIKAALDSDFEPDYFYFLNPDAYTLPRAIDQLVYESVKNNDNCLLGSSLHNEKLEARTSAFRFPNIISEFQRGAHLGIIDRFMPQSVVSMPLHTSTFECDWVSGAGFFFSKSVLNKIGYMDESYFLYYEEVDYMRHAKRLGVKILSVPDSKIVHIAGVSTQIVGGKTLNKAMPVYWYHSWHRFYFKNFSSIYATCCAIAWIKGRVINNLLSVVIKHRKPNDGHSIKRFFKYALLGKCHD